MNTNVFFIILCTSLSVLEINCDHHLCNIRAVSILRLENKHAQKMCYISSQYTEQRTIEREDCGVKCFCENDKSYCCSDDLTIEQNCVELTHNCAEIIIQTGEEEEIVCVSSNSRKRRNINEYNPQQQNIIPQEKARDRSPVTLPNQPFGKK